MDYLDVIPALPQPWNAQVVNDASFGVKTNGFGFDVIGDNWTFVVEACTNPGNSIWSPLATNIVTGGISYFNDRGWTNFPARFYRPKMP